MSRDSVAVLMYADLEASLRRRITDDGMHGSYPDEQCIKAADAIANLRTALASQIEITNTERGHAEGCARKLAALTREAAPQASGGDGDIDDGGPYSGIDWRASYETAQAEIADLRRRLATTDSAIQSRQGATGGAVSGDFPAPIRNPEAWPERYADGYNDALQLVIDCGFATRPAAGAGAPVGVDMRGLVEVLRDQRQCDEDGIYCIVSRQAVDEAIQVLAATPAVSVGDAKDAERWNFYVHAMTSDCGVARAAIQRQAFPAHTKEAWDACIDKAMSEVVLPEPANDAALEKERAE